MEVEESPADVTLGQMDVHLTNDDGSDEDDPGQGMLMDDEPASSPDLECLEELNEEDEDDSDDDDPLLAAVGGQKYNYAATARMFKMRRSLNQLDCLLREKEHEVLTIRETLRVCRQNVDSLVEQRAELEKQIEQQRAKDSSAAVFRLRAQHKQVCQKIQNEEELEGHINTELNQCEMELNKMEVDLERWSSLRQEVQEEESIFQEQKAQKGVTRLQQQKKASQNIKQKIKHLTDERAALRKKEEDERQKKAEAVHMSREKTDKHLKTTIKRIKQQKVEEEQQKKESVEKRIQAVKSLQSSIAANQETLRLQQRRVKIHTQKCEQQERQQKEFLQAQGINSIKFMHQQKRDEEIKRKQEEFTERRESKRAEIVAKIHQEEQQMKSKEKQKTELPSTKRLQFLKKAREEFKIYLELSPPSATEGKSIIRTREFSDTRSSSSASSDADELEDIMHQEEGQQSLDENLNEPESSGLWDWDYKKFLNEDTSVCTLVQTEARQEEPAITSGTSIIPRRVHGKELKGPPFISKPQVIHFKDFDVGKKYKKKITLTNISTIANQCKLLGVSSQLKDFISINFKPAGSLSTGMSCEMQAVFQPKSNKDLEGEVQFSSKAGLFSVPIRCTIKRCDLEVDRQFIDFGVHVVGQTISQTLTLSNKGALATFFRLDTSECHTPENSQVQMSSKEISSHDILSSNQMSSASMAPGEFQSKQDCQENSDALQQKESEVSAKLPDIPEACVSTDTDDEADQSQSDHNDISLGNVREGEIGPFESIKLEVIFTPTMPGETKLDFYITFTDATSKPIPIGVSGAAVTAVWVVKPNIDLKICMFDHHYQDNIIVQSRANKALKLTFEICPELKKHMKILPKTGFIQAQSTFTAQLKFFPRCSLFKDAENYFDSYTGVLEVPVTVQVAGQVKALQFVVNAIVTITDLQFDCTDVDFGYCPIYMSVKRSVHLTNLSLLPQEFAFIGVPEYMDVQPNDGFGTLLPQETLEIDLIFSPSKGKEYSFQLCCKSETNRDFLLSCRGLGVCPPLALSHNVVQFGGTAVGDHSTAVLHLINHETVKGGTAPASLRLFSFMPPTDSEISVTPTAGRLLPGEKCLVLATFRPRLSDQAIKDEAMHLFHEKETERKKPAEQETEQWTEKETPAGSRKGKKSAVPPSNSKVSNAPQMDQQSESSMPAEIEPGSQLYEEARSTLLRSFTRCYKEHLIPCFVSDRVPSNADFAMQPGWSPLNALYLKLKCPAVRPALVVTSGNGCNVLDFHQVIVGEKVIKRVTVQNISEHSLDLKSSVLDTNNDFCLLNALRCLKPGGKHTLVLAFRPSLEKKYCETLEVRCQMMTLEVILRGQGVVPVVSCSHPGGVLDFGYVLEKESTSQVLKLQNSSVVAVGFKVQLVSVCRLRHQIEAEYVEDFWAKPVVGTQNYSGLCVFSAVPVMGTIGPEQSVDINLTFHPDHPSVNYSDRVTIELTNRTQICVLDLKGSASSRNMYLYGGEPLMVPVESLIPPSVYSYCLFSTETAVADKHPICVLVTLKAKYKEGALIPGMGELHIGCIRSVQSSRKGGGEFSWDDVGSLQQQGFSVEPIKGTIEAGQNRTIAITWTPYCGYKPLEVVQTCVCITLKGDETTVYRVTLMGLVSYTDD